MANVNGVSSFSPQLEILGFGKNMTERLERILGNFHVVATHNVLDKSCSLLNVRDYGKPTVSVYSVPN